jgi:hypothetical protein
VLGAPDHRFLETACLMSSLNNSFAALKANLAALLFFGLPVVAHAQLEFERAPINYNSAPATDRIAKLQERLESGDAELKWDDKNGWLKSMLQTLDVPESSQALVFSRTSLQISRISPTRPRAIYFNDDIYIGWVQNGEVLELSAVDPQLGAVFYVLDQRDSDSPKIKRDRGECLSCHASSRTKGVPGFLVRSVFPGIDGRPFFGLGTTTTDHTTPLAERYGGWYVTGQHGDMGHRGNSIAKEDQEPPIDVHRGANRDVLPKHVESDAYLHQDSDLVALMVLEHQSQMHNLITRAQFEAKLAAHYDKTMNKVLERPEDYQSESRQRRIISASEKLLKYMLFCNEFSLTSPVKGTTSFQADFESCGPKDKQGRSLRQFDLKTRMFRYPCSFLIHSDSYAALPAEIRDEVEIRLMKILRGQDQSEDFIHLDEETRTAILEILRDTLPGFKERLEN